MRKATICFLVVLLGFGQSSASKNKSYPQIVAKVHRTNQTGPISPITLLVPNKDGLYRVSAYLETINIDDGQPLAFEMTWTDDLGAQTSSTCVANDSGNSTIPTPVITTMKVKAGTALNYSVPVVDFCKRSGTYNVFFTVERLE